MKNIIDTLQLIPKNYKFKSYLLIILLLIGSIFEIIGVGIFLPLLNELTSSNVFYLEAFKEYLNQNFGINENQIIYIFLLFIFFIFLIKNLFLSFLVYFKNSYI